MNPESIRGGTMKGRSLSALLYAAVLLLCVAASAAAGPGFTVKLKSGATYVLTQANDGTITVSKPSGTTVGTIRHTGSQFEAFDTSSHSLGVAPHINPEAVTLIDAHLAGGL
jgi:hypothetical protein